MRGKRAVLYDIGYMCWVCGLEWPRTCESIFESFGDICDCCGAQTGLTYSVGNSYSPISFRRCWLAAGAEWAWPKYKPEGWDLAKQLARLPPPFRRGLNGVDTPGEVWARTGPPLADLPVRGRRFPTHGQPTPDSRFVCRVCGQAYKEFMPWGPGEDTPSWEMCDCCGVEFGHEDATLAGIVYYRECWQRAGYPWFNGPVPMQFFTRYTDPESKRHHVAQLAQIPDRYLRPGPDPDGTSGEAPPAPRPGEHGSNSPEGIAFWRAQSPRRPG